MAIEAFKALFKLAVYCTIAWLVIGCAIEAGGKAISDGTKLAGVILSASLRLIMFCAIAALGFAALDQIFVRREFAKKMRMSKRELKREHSPQTKIEILTPDFRGKGRMERALEILAKNPPDVFNHNLETVPDLYRNVRPGADYQWSLTLLQQFKAQHPDVPTKSGIMLGLGETMEQVEGTLRDLRAHDVDMVTIGQYLQPSAHHHPVMRYWTPDEFKALEVYGMSLGFTHVASGPMVRSSYHADKQAADAGFVSSP